MVATVLENQQATTPFMSPQELAGLFEMKRFGFNLLEVAVCPSSPLRGQIFQELSFPAGARLLFALRDGYPLVADAHTLLREGDRLFMVAKNTEALRKYFMFGL